MKLAGSSVAQQPRMSRLERLKFGAIHIRRKAVAQARNPDAVRAKMDAALIMTSILST